MDFITTNNIDFVIKAKYEIVKFILKFHFVKFALRDTFYIIILVLSTI